MNDKDLKRRLAGLPVPPASETACERALHRSLIALRQGPDTSSSRPRVPFVRRLAGALALPAILLVIGLVFFRLVPAREGVASWQRTLQEMEALFPGQINAVIERDGDYDVELASRSVGSDEQPLIVEFSQGDRVLRVLSYSGRRVSVDLGGQVTSFEPLVTVEGDVSLTGDDFLWTEDHPASPAGYKVTARFLPCAS